MESSNVTKKLFAYADRDVSKFEVEMGRVREIINFGWHPYVDSWGRALKIKIKSK